MICMNERTDHTDYIAAVLQPILAKTPLFQVNLDDFSMPPFGTSTKDYYGTEEDLRSFNESVRKRYRFDMAEPSATRVDCLGVKASVQPSYHFSHINTWGGTYEVDCELIEAVHVWVRNNEGFSRCLKARITNGTYISIATDQPVSLGGAIWGHPGIIEIGPHWLSNSLFVVEKRFKTVGETILDYSNFDSRPILTEWLNDIFGDG